MTLDDLKHGQTVWVHDGKKVCECSFIGFDDDRHGNRCVVVGYFVNQFWIRLDADRAFCTEREAYLGLARAMKCQADRLVEESQELIAQAKSLATTYCGELPK